MVVVLFLFLGDTRSALIVAATLILTPLVTFFVMDRFDLTANLMSLGGLAIAIGMMVDASVVLVENIHRHMSDPRNQGLPRQALILNAAREVARPVVFGIMIIIIVFMPILSFQGMEGKMFKPMAYTIMIAMMVSLILSITLSPVLCLLTLKAGHADSEPWVLRRAKRLYLPMLRWALGHRNTVLITTGLMLAGSIALFPFLGSEFVPILNEGTMAPSQSACRAFRWNNRSRSNGRCRKRCWSFLKCR